MESNLRKKPPNPNGNPNMKKRWTNFADPTHVRLPPELHSLYKDVTTAINSGKIKITDLENMCIDWSNVERQLTTITEKPSLSVVPDIERGETIAELKARADEYQAKYREKLQEVEFLSNQLRKADRREKVDEAISEEVALTTQFEAEQSASWGQSPNQRGEFKTTSRSWDKFNEFKIWLAKQ